jgi:NADH:ubiquinone reductase (H+-translocating)
LADAIKIRQRVLLAFEKAEVSECEEERQRLMTMVVVGGGPTGVELAGAFAELSRHVLRTEFRRIDPLRAKVVLIEAGPRILAHLPLALSESATTQLSRLGVDVRTATRVLFY